MKRNGSISWLWKKNTGRVCNEIHEEAGDRVTVFAIKHNKEHEKDILKWIQRTKEANQDGVADDLTNVLELSQQISGYYETTLSKLKHKE